MSLIDLPFVDRSEQHNQSTHVWVSGDTLELIFDFGVEYNLTEFHFWNYFAENFDVDDIDLVFYDSDMNAVGTLLDISPELGDFPDIVAEDFPLQIQNGVRFVRVTLSGSNTQVDFNNIGFTGVLSEFPVVLGDANLDGVVDFADISSFIAILLAAEFLAEADIDGSGVIDFMDIQPFIAILSGG